MVVGIKTVKRDVLLIIVLITMLALIYLATIKPYNPTNTIAQVSDPDIRLNNQSNKTVYTGSYHDGDFIGSAFTGSCGTIKVAALITVGKITEINFIQMPNDSSYTKQITKKSEPLLLKETLHYQKATVNTLTGATCTSQNYTKSLQSALMQAI